MGFSLNRYLSLVSHISREHLTHSHCGPYPLTKPEGEHYHKPKHMMDHGGGRSKRHLTPILLCPHEASLGGVSAPL
jgi:hypothetical protein